MALVAIGLAMALYAESIRQEKLSVLLRNSARRITTTTRLWERMLGATILIKLSLKRMFAPLVIPPINPHTVRSITIRASIREDNQG